MLYDPTIKAALGAWIEQVIGGDYFFEVGGKDVERLLKEFYDRQHLMDYLREMVIQVVLYGNSYLFLGDREGWKFFNPLEVKVEWEQELIGYEYRGKRYLPEEMVHIHYVPLEHSPYFALEKLIQLKEKIVGKNPANAPEMLEYIQEQMLLALEVPPFVLGLGEYSEPAWEHFVMKAAKIRNAIEKELNQKLFQPPVKIRLNGPLEDHYPDEGVEDLKEWFEEEGIIIVEETEENAPGNPLTREHEVMIEEEAAALWNDLIARLKALKYVGRPVQELWEGKDIIQRLERIKKIAEWGFITGVLKVKEKHPYIQEGKVLLYFGGELRWINEELERLMEIMEENYDRPLNHVLSILEEMKGELLLAARTDLHHAANLGKLYAYKQAGIKNKRYVSIPSDCPECNRLDGTEIKLMDKFKGKWLVPPLHKGCRCTIYVKSPLEKIEHEDK